MDDNEELEIRRDVQNDYVLGMTYKEMSAKYNIPENTLKSWRKRGVGLATAPQKRVA